MTKDLLTMADWMTAQGVTQIATQSTGVYWKPIYAYLEGGELEIIVTNSSR